MKAYKLFYAAIALAGVFMLSGCTTGAPCGWIATDVTLPVSANRADYNVTATASCHKFFGLWCSGDASIEAAVRQYNSTTNHKIKYISSVDMQVSEVLGWATYTVIVRGWDCDPNAKQQK